MPTDPSSAESTVYSIVVVGAMNPRIHHPSWYHAVRLMPDDEHRAALESPIVCTPPLASFRTPGFEVLCTEDRWEIKSSVGPMHDRLLNVACGVFEKLFHTPVRAFGVNVIASRTTNLPDVGEYIAKHVANLPFGLETDGRIAGSIRMRCTAEKRQLTIGIDPLPQARNMVQINMNFHHPTMGQSDAMFDLGPLLRGAFDADTRDAGTQIDSVVAALNRRSGD